MKPIGKLNTSVGENILCRFLRDEIKTINVAGARVTGLSLLV